MEKKVCTGCNKEKSLTEYHKRRNAKDGFKSACKECRNAQSKKYYQENKEKVKATHKKWQKENPEKVKAYSKKWEKENPEKARASKRLKDSKRRAQKRNTQVEVITDELLKEYWIKKNIDPQRCFYCEDRPYEHLEHCIPLSRGGTHTKDNLVPACASCNLSKGTKTPDEWEG